MAFHRLTVPSYFGGLPGGYDYVNNAISGTPALADSARADSGPNNGTYFVGTGENARAFIANRGLKALAQNCDLLDDYAHRDLAIPAVTADVTAGGTVTSIVLTGPIFIGMAGTPNTVAGIRTFVTLVDAEDNEIYNGTECQVTAISPDVPGAVWSAGNVTLTISPGIPITTVYRVYYSTRGNTTTLLDDALVGSRRKYNRYNGGASWADGTTNPATFVTAQLDKMLTELAASTGANKLGYDGGVAWADGTTNPATTLGLQIDKILTDLSGATGADKIGWNGGAAWADGTTNPAIALGLQIDKILTDLSASTGTEKIGDAVISGSPYAGPGGTLRAQLVNIWSDLNAESSARTTFETPITPLRNWLSSGRKVISPINPWFISTTSQGPSPGFGWQMQPAVITTDITVWGPGTSGWGVTLVHVITGSALAFVYSQPLDLALHHGKTLAGAVVSICPNGIGGQPIPGLLPRVAVRRIPRNGQNGGLAQGLRAATGGWGVDASPNVTAYALVHDITYTADQFNVIDVENYYYDICVQRDAFSTFPTNSFQIFSLALDFT